MFYDDLPIWGFIGKLEELSKPSGKEVRYYLFTHGEATPQVSSSSLLLCPWPSLSSSSRFVTTCLLAVRPRHCCLPPLALKCAAHGPYSSSESQVSCPRQHRHPARSRSFAVYGALLSSSPCHHQDGIASLFLITSPEHNDRNTSHQNIS